MALFFEGVALVAAPSFYGRLYKKACCLPEFALVFYFTAP
jgi:hypothetical protein